ncbi:FtsW/RodA/SpoVE family cell cycle protein [Ahrensia sp. R2A130]|uniref:FtsW/RodA/SpoVE family cell cycle protein n=1 Tax=Ahrensia sp. R2A130 TaxID=744979 RepID=UPI0005916C56|nr:putative peptidoglycan glycosyltransferase FtsW [Ahrensia sp. R2A130]
MMSRARKSPVADWWWSVDRLLLLAALLLLAFGFLLSLSSSPAATHRLPIDDNFHFVKRHAVFVVLAFCVLIGTSFLDIRNVRRLAFLGFAGALLVMLALPFMGYSAKGATRWFELGPIKLQPSEFLKPTFVIVSAFLFSESSKRPDIPCTAMAMGLYLLCAGLLIIQPDFGQTVLVTVVWGAMFFMAGMSWRLVGFLGGLAVVGSGAAYTLIPHVRDRIDRFVTGTGDTFQVDRGLQAITNGGWLGQGPGEGSVKYGLPDSHTDFIFSVAAEEFGILLAMVLVGLFAFVVLRGLWHGLSERDRFVQLAVCGLVLQFGVQACINLAVNLQLIPAKGMTLPFISYGGSSLIAVAFGMGLVLALTRKRAESYRRSEARTVRRPVQLAGAPA